MNDQQLIARVCEIQLIAEYAPVNDAGAITGPFIPLFDVTRAYASKSPIRDSIKVDVPLGRYTVRFRRGDAALQPPSGTSACNWVGLRSFLKGNNSFPVCRRSRSACWRLSRHKALTSSACWERASCRSGTARPSSRRPRAIPAGRSWMPP